MNSIFYWLIVLCAFLWWIGALAVGGVIALVLVGVVLVNRFIIGLKEGFRDGKNKKR